MRNPASAKLARGGQIRQEELKEVAVIDAIVDGLVIVDTDGKIIVVNPALEKLTGYKKSEIVGKNVVDLMKKVVKTEDLEKAMKGLRTALKGKLYLPSETLALATKDGREISIIITASFMKDSGEKPSTAIFVLKDITKRKQVEDALKESEQKYRTLVESLPQKIFLKDRDSVYVSCNEAYAEDLKIKPADIVGKTDYDFYPKKLAEKYRADDKRIMESEKTEDIEEEYIQDGQKVFVHTAKTPVKDENGHVIGVLGIFWDITEQKKSEEALKESEQRFRAIFDSANDGILVADAETKKFRLGNKAICKMLGYGQEDIKNLGVMDIHHKENLPHVIEQFERQAKREIEVDENVPVKRKDGSVFYADISSSPIILNEKTCLVGIFRDITERKKVEEEKLKAAADRQRIHQLEKFSKVAVDRELKMVELKKRIKALESKLKEEITGKR